MAKNISKYLLLLLTAALFTSCDKGPVFSTRPEIEFVSMTPTEAEMFSTVRITIRYQDGDGDLGSNVESEYNLYVVDNRPTVPDSGRIYRYHMPDLSPDSKNPSIQGTIDIDLVVPFIYTVPMPASEETDFTIYLYDRAENKSNEIITPKLTIKQP